jgi:hypothetical protein
MDGQKAPKKEEEEKSKLSIRMCSNHFLPLTYVGLIPEGRKKTHLVLKLNLVENK